MLNSRHSTLKRGHIDLVVDSSLYLLFFLLAFLCTFGAAANYLFMHGVEKAQWYLPAPPEIRTEAILSWFTYLVLLDILIPISLYVSMELVRFVQAFLISRDTEMYYLPNNCPAQARTSNLNEELGQITHIFTDKTGTLTGNIMNVAACSVGNYSYGLELEEKATIDPIEIKEMENWPENQAKPAENAKFYSKQLLQHLADYNHGHITAHNALTNEFLTLISSCHSVVPSSSGPSGAIKYIAASPDEISLVEAARNHGFHLLSRCPARFTVGGSVIQGETLVLKVFGSEIVLELYDILEFSSERARQSVILRDSRDNKIKIYTKGADSKLYKLLDHSGAAAFTWNSVLTDYLLGEYSRRGLRTLVCAWKELSAVEFSAWFERHKLAKAAIHGREQLIERSNAEIEQNLQFLGISSIEDELQAGVPATIEKILAAGMKIMVLTGDKSSTAINIGRSAALITPEMDQNGLISILIDERLAEFDAKVETFQALNCAYNNITDWARENPKKPFNTDLALIINGSALSHILPVAPAAQIQLALLRPSLVRQVSAEKTAAELKFEGEIRAKFMKVLEKCKAVICCRTSPSQKAQIVELVREFDRSCVSLAIGDGANDVSMIKAAHVGVGIAGLEGNQAANSSDYSIAQFRFLQRLLLVHGAWNYRRTSDLILYSFYKNTALALTNAWFAIYSGWSGQLYFDAYAGSVYNIFFTALPILLVGTINRYCSADNRLIYPELYRAGLEKRIFNLKSMCLTIFEGICHSLALFYLPISLFLPPSSQSRSNSSESNSQPPQPSPSPPQIINDYPITMPPVNQQVAQDNNNDPNIDSNNNGITLRLSEENGNKASTLTNSDHIVIGIKASPLQRTRRASFSSRRNSAPVSSHSPRNHGVNVAAIQFSSRASVTQHNTQLIQHRQFSKENAANNNASNQLPPLVTSSELNVELPTAVIIPQRGAPRSIGSFSTRQRLSSFAHGKILVVDDNITILKTVYRQLESISYQADLAENGLIALERVKNNDYDMIFLDCEMPVCNGYEACRLIREYERKRDKALKPLYIVALTANAMEECSTKCTAAGMNHVITKPLTKKILAQQIEIMKKSKHSTP
jgi:phospholipid-transporting ATPase